MYIKKSLMIFVTVLVALTFSGCSFSCSCPEPETIVKIEYRDKECSVPKIKPVFKEYDVLVLEINGEEYYALPKPDALIMSSNWISYKQWAEANYTLMKKDETTETTETTEDTKDTKDTKTKITKTTEEVTQ